MRRQGGMSVMITSTTIDRAGGQTGDRTGVRDGVRTGTLFDALTEALRPLLAAGLAVGALFSLSACATNSYGGVYFGPNVSDFDVSSEVRSLARRARDGDRKAVYELGVRYLEGDGLHMDYEWAERLLRRAMIDIGGPAYSSVDGGVPNYQGPLVEGIADARQRWIEARSLLAEQRAQEAAPYYLSYELGIAARLAVDRRLGRAGIADFPIQSVEPQRVISGFFEEINSREESDEVCAAMETLIRQYRPYDFTDCTVWHLLHHRAANAEDRVAGEEPHLVFQLRYRDGLMATSSGVTTLLTHGSPRLRVRPAFVDFTSFPTGGGCREFVSSRITMTSGKTYDFLLKETSNSASLDDEDALCEKYAE